MVLIGDNFVKKSKSIFLSLVVMALWGSLFPCVKLGYSFGAIDSSSVADILMFAAIRFAACGAIVCLFCILRRKNIEKPSIKSIGNILLIGLFAIVLHYSCTYIGLSTTDSSKTALLKQSGALIYVCFSFLFFKDEKFSIYKIIGAVVGFCGIIAINFSKSSFSFSFGDILILCASVCTVVQNIISGKSTQNCSALWLTGISQLFGGIVLLIVSVSFGGVFPQMNLKFILVFTYICIASIIAYTLWYYVLRISELSKLFIIKFAEPLFACVFGAVILNEDIFKLQYLAAFILISAGIFIGHIRQRRKDR